MYTLRIFIILLCSNLLVSKLAFAQNVGIGTTTPDPSAKLDIESTSSGLLVPRMTSAQRSAIASPATGLLVFDTDSTSFWFFDGTLWTGIEPTSDTDWTRSGSTIYNDIDSIAIGRVIPTVDLHVAFGKKVLFGDAAEDSSGYKLIWFGDRGALRFGYLSPEFASIEYDKYWDPLNVGFYSLAAGYNSRASGWGSVAFGGGNASGSNSFAFDGTASGSGSFSFDGDASGFGSIAFKGNATYEGAIAMNGVATGLYSVAIGGGGIYTGGARATGSHSSAMGWASKAEGYGSVALGQSTAHGTSSFSANWLTNAYGYYSSAFGYGTEAYPYASMALGRYNKIVGDTNSWISADPVFMIGNGTTDSTRFTAFTVLKNGRVGVNTVMPSEYLHIKGAADVNILLEADTNNVTETDHPQLKFSQDGGIVTGYIGYSGGTNHLRIANEYANTDADIDFVTQTATRMTIDGNGNVGIGTTSPIFNLHVGDGTMGGTNTSDTRVVVSDNTNDNRAAFLTLARDAAGNKIEGQFESDGEFNDAIIFGSTTSHPIFVRTGNFNRMYIAATGEVGIGTTTPAERLQVNGNIYASGGDIYLSGTNGVINAGGGIMSATINVISDATPTPAIVAGDEDLYIDDDLELGGQGYKPGGGSWATPSDRRLKQNINRYRDGLDKILKINPVSYQYNETFQHLNNGETYYGIIAQDMQEIAPYMIKEEMLGQRVVEDEEGNEIIVEPGNPYLVYDATALTYMLVNAVKELDQKVSEIELLKTQLQDLEEKFDALQQGDR